MGKAADAQPDGGTDIGKRGFFLHAPRSGWRGLRVLADADGQPEILHDPSLSTAEEAKREYRILGAETLDTPEPWTDVTNVPDLDATRYRVFKVKGRMKE